MSDETTIGVIKSDRDFFGSYESGWDPETGKPGISLFANAVQVWAALQNRERVTIQQAAMAFKAPVAMIVEAVEYHPWMFLSGDLIEHEGE